MHSAIALKIWVAVVCSVVLAGLAQADTITVGPGGGYNYDNIKDAIATATNGDTVLVADGTYTGPDNKNLDFGGLAITLQSENGPGNCIIDCENDGRGFYFHSGESETSVVCGFTIMNGYVSGYGGGIHCVNSSPTIKNCVISNNSTYSGSGMYCGKNSSTIINCTFRNNSADNGSGGGLYIHDSSSPILKNCLFLSNSAGGSGGGGVYITGSCNLTFNNCTFSENSAPDGKGGGIRGYEDYSHTTNVVVTNCIFWDNTASSGSQFYCNGSASCSASYSSVQGGFSGVSNIDTDPCFVDVVNGDYHLQDGSPCIDTGINNPPGGLPATDIEGTPRPLDGDSNGTYVADMGAYESLPGNEVVIAVSQLEEFTYVKGFLNPEDQILSISNSGGGILNWEITETCDWLDVDPNMGSSTGDVNDVTLSVDVDGLVSGNYNCELIVSDPCALNNPQTVQVRLHIGGSLFYVPSEYSTIQAAIDAAGAGDTIIVADGTYTGPDNKNLDFGGLAITLQSENGPENCIIDCENNGRGFYFHSGEDGNSVVSGFTVKRGYIIGDSDSAVGAGIYCSGASPTIKNCIITDNTAHGASGNDMYYGGFPTIDGQDGYGGGIYCISDSNPTIINSVIISNIARGGKGAETGIDAGNGKGGNSYGGGIYFGSDSNPTIEGCVITENTALGGKGGYFMYANGKKGGNSYGAGIYCATGSLATITNCMVNNNEAMGGNGPDYPWNPSYVYNAGNGGDALGGGIYSQTSGECTIENCTIADNITSGGIGGTAEDPPLPDMDKGDDGEDGNTYGAGVYCDAGSTVTIDNSIIWDNDANEIDGVADVNYSDVEGGYSGNNIDADPLFVTGPSGDYYLSQIAAGQGADSLCVNTGSDTAANLGMDIFTTRTDKVWDEGVVDMGYHYSQNIADLDDDGDVDLADFAILGFQWEQAPGIPSADIAPNGGNEIVDMEDIDVFCDNWLWRK